jgi:hypothetical protein
MREIVLWAMAWGGGTRYTSSPAPSNFLEQVNIEEKKEIHQILILKI